MSNRRLLIALAVSLGVLGAAAVMATSCGSHPRVAAGAQALVDCEVPNLKAAVAELLPLAKLAVLRLISGDGHVDTERLRAAGAALLTDLPRCALASAVAILAAPAPTAGATIIAQPLAVPDPGALRLAFEAVRQDWGGASYRTAGGTI